MLTGVDDFLDQKTKKNQIVGTWGFDAKRDFTRSKPNEINYWFFEQSFHFLRSFFGLVLPDNLEITTYNAKKQIKRKDLKQQTFLDELMLIIKGLSEPIWTLRINLNIIGFVRTEDSLGKTRRLQIQEPCSFIVWGGPDESGYQTFSISYRLFNSSLLEGADEMLWSLNQPLLEKALKKWEKQTGFSIESVKTNKPGSAKPHRYGFHQPKGHMAGSRLGLGARKSQTANFARKPARDTVARSFTPKSNNQAHKPINPQTKPSSSLAERLRQSKKDQKGAPSVNSVSSTNTKSSKSIADALAQLKKK